MHKHVHSLCVVSLSWPANSEQSRQYSSHHSAGFQRLPSHYSISHSSNPPRLVALQQIRGELITQGYHDSSIWNTTGEPRIFCLTLWFELVQTGLILTASDQRTSHTLPFEMREQRARSRRRATRCSPQLFLYEFSTQHMHHSSVSVSLALCTAGSNS